MIIGVPVHPIDQNPEGVTLTTDSQLEENKGILQSHTLKSLSNNSQTKKLATVSFLHHYYCRSHQGLYLFSQQSMLLCVHLSKNTTDTYCPSVSTGIS